MRLLHAVVDGPGAGGKRPVLALFHLVGQKQGGQGEVLGGAEVVLQGIVEAQPLVQFLLGGRLQGQEVIIASWAIPRKLEKKPVRDLSRSRQSWRRSTSAVWFFWVRMPAHTDVKVGILPRKGLSQVSRLARKRSQRLRKAWSIIHSPLGKACCRLPGFLR